MIAGQIAPPRPEPSPRDLDVDWAHLTGSWSLTAPGATRAVHRIVAEVRAAGRPVAWLRPGPCDRDRASLSALVAAGCAEAANSDLDATPRPSGLVVIENEGHGGPESMDEMTRATDSFAG